MSEDRDKRLAQLKQAYENGTLDEDTYQTAVASTQGYYHAHVQSGAIAQGAGAIAVGEYGILARDVGGSIITGSNNLIIGGPVAGLQGQAFQQSLQALFAQAFVAVMRPQIEDIFHVIRDPASVPVAIFGPTPQHLVVKPYEVPYQPCSNEAALAGRRWQALLLSGRSGLGRTRQVARLAGRLCQAGWTVCIARLDNCRKMGEPTGVLPDRRLLFVIDDLYRHISAGDDGETSYLERLAACLAFFERILDTELLVLATMPEDIKVIVEPTAEAARVLWQSFTDHALAELPTETLQVILETAARLGGVTIPEGQAAVMAADSDGTPKTMVANVNQAGIAGEALTVERWHNTWRGTWESSFQEVRYHYPLADGVYEALHLLQLAGVPARTVYVSALSDANLQVDAADTVAALVQRGLLRAEEGVLVPFANEQIEVSLQSVDKVLPDLAQHWDRLIDTLLKVDTPVEVGVSDLVALTETLFIHHRDADAERIATAVLARVPEHAQAFFQRGLVRAHQNKYHDAIDDFSAALAQDYRPARAYLMRGLSRLMLAKYSAAGADFTAAITEGETLAYKGRGLARIFQQEFAGTVSDLTEALLAAPEEGELYYLRGFALHMQKATAAAAADFTRAIEAGYEAAYAFFARGWLYWQTGDMVAAEADFSRVLEHEDTPIIYFLRGYARYRQSDLTGSEADFSVAIERRREDTYSALLQKIAHALDDETADVSVLLAKHPDWIRELIAALPGVGLPEELTDEALVSLSQFWGRFMDEQLAGQGIHFSFFKQLAGHPYLGRGLVRLDLKQYTQAAADFAAATDLGSDPALTYYGLGLARFGLGEIREGIAALSTALEHNPAAVQTYFWRGYGNLTLGNHADAEADLTMVITSGYNDVRAYHWRGLARLSQNLLSQAEEDFSTAIAQDAQNLVGYFMRGAVRYDLGRYEAAEADFDQAVRGGYDEAALFVLRGWSRFRQEKYDQAEADFTATLQRDPEVTQAYYGRGAARLNREEYAAAEPDYTAAIERGLTDPGVYVERAAARLELEQYAGARNDLNIALAAGLTGPNIYFGLASAAYGLEGYEEAVANYTLAIDMGLDWPHLYARRGWSHYHLAQYEAAVNDLDIAIADGKANARVYYWRALARLNLEDYAGVVADTTAALARGQSGPMVYAVRGLAYWHQGEYAAAEPDLSQAIDGGLAGVDTHLWRAIARYFERDVAGVTADCTAALGYDAGNADAYAIRALAYVHLGKIEAAQQDCEQAGRLAPDSALSYDCRAALHLAAGEVEAALTAYQTSYNLEPGTETVFMLAITQWLAGQYKESLALFTKGVAAARPANITLAQWELAFWATHLAQRSQSAAAQKTRQQIETQLSTVLESFERA
jgi:Tfp pilus assembly protein PilF